MTILEQSTSCSRPFEWAEIHPDGAVFLCCPAWLRRPVGNLLRQPFAEIWNGPTAIEIRKSILNGSYHNCNRKGCPRLLGAQTGIETSAIDAASPSGSRAVERRQLHLDELPPRLNLCFDHSCNLSCPSCRPAALISSGASRRQAERIAAKIEEQLLPSAHQLTLSGYGDPFASPVYFGLLQRIRRQNAPFLNEVRLHSNGLLFDAAHWQLLPELHPLLAAVEISVDAGCAATYALNRGGDYARLLENLTFIAGLGVPLRLSMVVQQNNYREIGALYELARGLGGGLYLSRLVNWGTFRRQEHAVRDVGAQGHPEHGELLEILRGLKGESGVDFGNLVQLLAS